MSCHLALIHHPVLNKNKEEIATNITNYDIHDIARVCRTYDVESYFIVHPSLEQLAFVERVCSYWTSGHGKSLNTKRGEALRTIKTAESLDSIVKKLDHPVVISTSAQKNQESSLEDIDYKALRAQIKNHPEKDFLIVMGTGFGLTREVLLRSDLILTPVRSEGSYNHLSVRVCAGIILDRLLG